MTKFNTLVEEIKEDAALKAFTDNWNMQALYLADVHEVITTTATRVREETIKNKYCCKYQTVDHAEFCDHCLKELSTLNK